MKPNTELTSRLAGHGFRPLGSLKTKHARDIDSSPWSIGCETTDRGYVDFDQVGPHLGPLGAKHVRIQAGWATCDRGPGTEHDWSRLDRIVDGALAQGVTPWLEVSYGNPAYPGGGGIGLSQGIPTSPEALEAWDRWITSLVTRYRDRVTTWEIWNEPNNRDKQTGEYTNQPEDFAVFHARTARGIRAAQPEAEIVALALSWHDGIYAPRFWEKLKDLDALDTVDVACVHGYGSNPDDAFQGIEHFFQQAKSYRPEVKFLQGEAGSNSVPGSGLAMGTQPWSERKQAVWNLRRMLAHHARGIRMNLFQLADMYYEKGGGALFEVCNTKGLLRIAPDKSVAYRKPSYFAAQHLFTLFDGRVDLKPLTPHPVRSPHRMSAYTWESSGTPVIFGWWHSRSEPDLYADREEGFGLDALPVEDPVLVDLLGGTVFELSDDLASNDLLRLQRIPLYDSPLLLVRRDWLELQTP